MRITVFYFALLACASGWAHPNQTPPSLLLPFVGVELLTPQHSSVVPALATEIENRLYFSASAEAASECRGRGLYFIDYEGAPQARGLDLRAHLTGRPEELPVDLPKDFCVLSLAAVDGKLWVRLRHLGLAYLAELVSEDKLVAFGPAHPIWQTSRWAWKADLHKTQPALDITGLRDWLALRPNHQTPTPTLSGIHLGKDDLESVFLALDFSGHLARRRKLEMGKVTDAFVQDEGAFVVGEQVVHLDSFYGDAQPTVWSSGQLDGAVVASAPSAHGLVLAVKSVEGSIQFGLLVPPSENLIAWNRELPQERLRHISGLQVTRGGLLISSSEPPCVFWWGSKDAYLGREVFPLAFEDFSASEYHELKEKLKNATLPLP